MTRVKVEVHGLDRLERKLQEIPGAMRRLVEKAVDYGEKQSEIAAVPHPGKDKGVWGLGRDIVKSEVSGGAVPLHARVYTRSVIAIVAHEGRQPGGRRPPIKAIRHWAERHGITSSVRGGGLATAAFRIARHMGRAGSKGIKFLDKGGKALEGKLPDLVRETEAEIKRKWEA